MKPRTSIGDSQVSQCFDIAINSGQLGKQRQKFIKSGHNVSNLSSTIEAFLTVLAI
ncbi:MAG: hypothetical protein DHS20C11_18460 [Lysobacteraceae bacterium]|nr:MAG: hypothetical protein DHS20C11_18460 [Xanthomonadaceae bacterium]